jgi:peptidoglycan hydrolase-like protein with peptidoglycan-binding domain/V8-like Glu-specific endopeptidase
LLVDDTRWRLWSFRSFSFILENIIMTGRRHLFSVVIASLITLAGPSNVSAGDAGSALVGGIIGGIIGGVMSAPQSQLGQKVPTSNPRPVIVVERVMNIQKALAFFGYFKGTVDGISGPSTKRAVRDYLKASNLPLSDDLTDDQYAALLKQYSERLAPSAAGVVTQKPAQPSGPMSVDSIFNAIEGPTDTAAKLAFGFQPNGSDKAAYAPRMQLRDLCIASAPLRVGADTSQTLKIKKHLCSVVGPIAAEANTQMASSETGKVEAITDRCSELSEAVLAAVPLSTPPAVAMENIRPQFAGISSDQLDQVKKMLKICLGFDWTLGKASATRAMAIALGGSGDRAIVEIVAAQMALGVESEPNPGLAADWYDAAANGGGTIADLTLQGKQSDAAFFRALARELREEAKTKAQEAATQGTIGQTALAQKIDLNGLTNAPSASSNDASNGTPMTRPLLADHIRNSIVIILNTDNPSSGTGFFISPTIIITNTHVVEGAKKVIVANKVIGIRSANVVAKGMTKDYKGIDAAVLQTNNFSSQQFLTVNQKIKEGQAIAIGGYPGIAQKGFDRSYDNFMAVVWSGRVPDIDNIPSPKFDFGSTQALMTNSQDGFHNIQVGLQTAHGNSGSPIVNFCGEVVGLHYEGTPVTLDIMKNDQGKPVAFGSTTNYGFALRADEVVKFLKSLRINYQERSTDCREP